MDEHPLTRDPPAQQDLPSHPQQAPRISVILPTFNRAGYLPETLDSLRAQTLHDYELLVVDDGSTDNTAELLRSRPEPLRYFWQKNGGPAAARNAGLEHARGEFVAFLDSDDLWEPRFLEAASTYLKNHPHISIVFCRTVTIDNQGRALPGHVKRPYAGDITARLFTSTFISTPSVLARRKVICEAGGFDTSLPTNEDYDLWLRLSLRYEFGLVDEPLFLRRSHPGSQSRQGSPVPLIRKARLLERFYHRLGGSAKVPADVAYRRLAKVYYAAGKGSHAAHRYAEARELFGRSLRYRRASPKVCAWYLLASLLRHAPGDRSSIRLAGMDRMPE